MRPAAAADIPALLDLYQHLFPGDARPDDAAAERAFAQFLTYRGSAILLGLLADRLVSSCVLVVVPNLTRGASPYGLIENVVTRSDCRSRGFAGQVLAAAEAAAWSQGCYKLMLLTGSAEAGVLALYRKAGFVQSKTGFQKRRIPARKDG